jgi:tetratricopeptide (TPR) repeat protein
MLRDLYLIFGLLLLSLFVVGQEDSGVKFSITVKHKSNAYPSALIKVYRSNSFLDQTNVDQYGEFSYLLPYGFVYQLHFTGDDMATKIIELDLISNIPESEKNIVHDWSIGEIELFKSYKEIDISKLAQPVARIHYESDMSEFSIDYKFTGKRKKELAGVEAQVEKLEKKEAAVEKENKKEYEDLVVKGNKALNSMQFKSARGYFEKAIVLNAEGEAKQKLNAINKVLQKEEKYDELLAEGNALFEKGELQQASERYVSASALNPTSKFPKQQIVVISQKIKQEEKQANAFNNYMAVANRAYSDGNYIAASAGYKKALNINPEALLATKKLQFSETKVKQKDEEEAIDQKFNNLIVEAKNARVKGDLTVAESFLAQAEAVKPENETLAAEKLTVALLKVEVKQKEEEEAIDQKFNNLIVEAKNARVKGDLTAAESFLVQAEAVKSVNETLAAEKLALASLKVKVKQKEEEEAIDQKFNNLIVEAKNARVKGDLASAESLLAQAEAVKPNNETLTNEKSALAMMFEEKQSAEAAAQLSLIAEKEKEEQFSKYMSLAENSEGSGNEKQAIFFYKKAQEYKPESTEVNAALAILNKTLEKNVTSKLPSTDPNIDLDKMDKKSSDFHSKLATLYPEGKTVNKSSKGNKAITQVILVNGGRGIEYQEIKYSWGGVYYFRNGDPITKLVFDKETK